MIPEGLCFGNQGAFGFCRGIEFPVAFVEIGAACREELVRRSAECGIEIFFCVSGAGKLFPFSLKRFEGFCGGVPFGGVRQSGCPFDQRLLGGGRLPLLLPQMGVIFIHAVLEFSGGFQIAGIDLFAFRLGNAAEPLPFVAQLVQCACGLRQFRIGQGKEPV